MAEAVPPLLRDALADRYLIESTIGTGGMATVFLAEDLKHGRKVAVKVLHPHLAEELGPERFLREIEIAAQMTHPHVLPLHDSGEAEGYLFYVMPFIEGESLRARLTRGSRLPVADAVRILREILEALGEAHRRGIVHRDVKPANVLMSGGHALVADFGVAKAVGAAGGETGLTSIGASLGTPEYMAPEQAAADPTLDGRADLFAASAIGYEMLTGVSPFHADTIPGIFAAVMTREPAPPHALRPEIPRSLSDAIMWGLTKDPGDRPQTADELIAALNAEAGRKRRGGSAANRQGVSRTRARWALAAIIVMAAVAGVSAVLDLSNGETPAGGSRAVSFEKLAVLPFANRMNDSMQDYFVDGITDALIIELANVRSISVASRTSTMQFRDSGQPVTEIAAALGADVILEGSVLRAGNDVRIDANLVDAARDEQMWASSYTGTLSDVLRLQANVVLDIVEQIDAVLTPSEESHLTSQSAVDPEAYDAYARGRHFWNQRTPQSFERALVLLNEAVRIQPDYALAHAGLADAYVLLGVYEFMDPRVAYPQALRAARQAIELDPSAGEPHTSVAHVLAALEHDWDGADAAYRRGIELSPSNPQGYLFHAYHLMSTGELDEARAAIEAALALDPLAPLAGSFLTQLELYHGNPRGAITMAERALEIDPDFPATLWRLGEAHLMVGQTDRAMEVFERVAEVTRRHPLFLSYLGLAYGVAGRTEDARDIIAEMSEKTEDDDLLAGRLARVYVGLGREDEAVAALGQSLGTGQMVFLDLRSGPVWDPLRGHDGFEAIMDRLGLAR